MKHIINDRHLSSLSIYSFSEFRILKLNHRYFMVFYFVNFDSSYKIMLLMLIKIMKWKNSIFDFF